ncbi:MAG: hypothetical protein QOF02_61 [Blastocatellia bacterium]|jgi:hypothetical protein|nr:hypothetical protein [Blastocatellia bacterium]
MRLENRKALKALALFLVFSLSQLYVHATLAGPPALKAAGATMPPPQAITARLTTRGNQAISVNGTSAATGATILTGATIETGDGVGATINLGPLGSVDLAPNTKLELQFDNDGIKLRLVSGCTVLRNKKGKKAEVSTEQGIAIKDEGSTSSGAGVPLDVCFPAGSPSPIVNQGAAANAGAGAGGSAAGAAGTAGTAGTAGGGGLFGLGTAGTVALLGGIGAAIIIPIVLTRGGDESVSRP